MPVVSARASSAAPGGEFSAARTSAVNERSAAASATIGGVAVAAASAAADSATAIAHVGARRKKPMACPSSGSITVDTPSSHVADRPRPLAWGDSSTRRGPRQTSRVGVSDRRPETRSLEMRRWVSQLQQRSLLRLSALGAGGNRTPVHQVLNVRATTVPDSPSDAEGPAGRMAVGYPAARESSFRIVIGLFRRQRSLQLSSPASVAGLRWIGPVRHFWSRCLFTHLKIRRRERTARWQFFFVPRLASLSNSGRTLTQEL